MRRIWKFSVGTSDTSLSLPEGAKIVHVGMNQYGALFFWAEIDPQALYVTRIFRSFCTGEEIPGGYRYVGTGIDFPPGELVLHLYEVERGFKGGL